MRRLGITLIATAAIVAAGAVVYKAEAQTSRGAADLTTQAKNFTPIEKSRLRTALGPLLRAVPSPCVRSAPLLVRALLIARPATPSRSRPSNTPRCAD